MSKSKMLVFIIVALVGVCVTAQSPAFKIGYLPTSIGQPDTNAWQAGMMRVFSKISRRYSSRPWIPSSAPRLRFP